MVVLIEDTLAKVSLDDKILQIETGNILTAVAPVTDSKNFNGQYFSFSTNPQVTAPLSNTKILI